MGNPQSTASTVPTAQLGGSLLLAMSIPTRGNEDLTPPSSLRDSPPTPPPTDEKKVQTTSSILRQVATHKPATRKPPYTNVDAKAWAAVSPFLLRKDKLRIDYLPSVER